MLDDRDTALRNIIDAQGGFFTLKQAVQTGFSEEEVRGSSRLRKWIQELDDVYRLPRYRYGFRADLIPYYLWVKERTGTTPTFSHHTALEIYELIDLLPMYTYLTVDIEAPQISQMCYGIVLHYAPVPAEDVQYFEWVPVTTIQRTIIDLVVEGRVAKDIIQIVCERAIENKLIESKEELLSHQIVQNDKALYLSLSELYV